MKNWLGSRSAKILTVVLFAQAAVFYGFSRSEYIPTHRPLSDFSIPNSNWSVVQDVELDKASLEVLKADDILSRIYLNTGTGQAATLFVAYFGTQQTGKTPHSPKNCLPGAGWSASQSGTIDIPISGERSPIKVNRYIVARGENQSVVLYWYQSRNRVVASEYAAKLYTIADAIRYNRSDTSLVRVVVAVNGGNIQNAVNTATSFVKAFFEPLKEYLPS